MKKTCLLILMLSATLLLQAQNDTIRPPRLKVGVVLGGGGAKGAAHIGVLKFLEEMGIPVDYVAGTSMGAIIGGFYALGYSPDELTQLISNMDWSAYIGNKIDRPMMSEEARQRNSTLLLQVPFSYDNFIDKKSNVTFISQLPSAYVNNSSLINLFNDLCVGYQEEMDFNDLPIPFACVATDMVSGKEVVLRSGSVPTAMRASMAIPGVFSPVEMDDKVLVDGGLVNNFPADVLRDMGADIIIGVEVFASKDVTANDLKSLPQVFMRLLVTSTSAKREMNRSECAVYILPDVSGFGMLSFTPKAIDTLVERGYKKACEFHDQFLAIKDAVDASAGHPVSKTLRAPHAKNLSKDSVLIHSVYFGNVSGRDGRWLLRKGRLELDQHYLQEDIERAMKIYRGTSCFDEITYQIKKSDSIYLDNQLVDAYNLNINMKPAKPHFFGLGVRYDTEEGAALLFNIGLNEKKFNGSKFNANIKLSYNPKIDLTYTYSRSSLANFNLGYQYRSEHFRTSDANMTNLVNLHYLQHRISGYISQFHLLNYCATVGASYTSTTFDNSSMKGNDFDSDRFVSNKYFVSFANIKYDNLDNAYFAEKGFCTSLSTHYYWNPKDASNNNFDISYAFQYYYTPNGSKITFIPQLYGRYLYHKPSHYNLMSKCGGEIEGRHFENQLPFIGITHLESTTENVSVARCDLRYNFYGKHYLTAMYNTLIGWNQAKYIYQGTGLKYSYNSLLGPISLTAQWTNLYYHHFSAYFSFGYTF